MERARRREMLFELAHSVCARPGVLTAAQRATASGTEGGAPLPKELDGLARTIRERAADVTDDAVAAARAAGHGDDALYELTVAAALGPATVRLAAALRALGRRA